MSLRLPNLLATCIGRLTAFFLLHNSFGAMPDVAIDALAVNTLREYDRGLANGVMFGGAAIGTAVGGAGVSWLRQSHELPLIRCDDFEAPSKSGRDPARTLINIQLRPTFSGAEQHRYASLAPLPPRLSLGRGISHRIRRTCGFNAMPGT